MGLSSLKFPPLPGHWLHPGHEALGLGGQLFWEQIGLRGAVCPARPWTTLGLCASSLGSNSYPNPASIYKNLSPSFLQSLIVLCGRVSLWTKVG